MSATHRPRAEGRRLPLRHDRPPGLPHRQPERRAAAPTRVTRAERLTGAVLGALFLALHLPFLPPSLEDLDSINFALGVRALRRLAASAASARLSAVHRRGEAAACGRPLRSARAQPARRASPGRSASSRACCCSPLDDSSADAVRPTGHADARAGSASCSWRVCPLFWFTAARPLSDMTGLAASLGVQALLLGGGRRRRALAVGGVSRGLRRRHPVAGRLADAAAAGARRRGGCRAPSACAARCARARGLCARRARVGRFRWSSCRADRRPTAACSTARAPKT